MPAIITSTYSISSSIRIITKRIFKSCEEERAAAGGEPGLVISLDYIAYVDGESVNATEKFWHDFADCSPSSLEALIAAKEPIPLDCVMDPEEAEQARGTIARTVSSLIGVCAKYEGLETLKVKIVVDSEEYEMGLLGKRRMLCVETGACRGGDGREEETCSICLEKMAGREEVARTPCDHRFHGRCIRRWFEESGECPLCRFRISP